MTGIAVDSSALVAVLENEPEKLPVIRAILVAPERYLGVFSYLEASIVLMARRGPAGSAMLDALIQELALTRVPLDGDQVAIARRCWLRFGKGRHPAALNIGDCCSYALASALALPLLCKGNDFPLTDLPLVDI